jgi:hypothetical protein
MFVGGFKNGFLEEWLKSRVQTHTLLESHEMTVDLCMLTIYYVMMQEMIWESIPQGKDRWLIHTARREVLLHETQPPEVETKPSNSDEVLVPSELPPTPSQVTSTSSKLQDRTSSSEQVTRSGRVVRPPKRLDLLNERC